MNNWKINLLQFRKCLEGVHMWNCFSSTARRVKQFIFAAIGYLVYRICSKLNTAVLKMNFDKWGKYLGKAVSLKKFQVTLEHKHITLCSTVVLHLELGIFRSYHWLLQSVWLSKPQTLESSLAPLFISYLQNMSRIWLLSLPWRKPQSSLT